MCVRRSACCSDSVVIGSGSEFQYCLFLYFSVRIVRGLLRDAVGHVELRTSTSLVSAGLHWLTLALHCWPSSDSAGTIVVIVVSCMISFVCTWFDCVCMYVCVYVCMHVCMYVCMHVCVY